VVNTDNNTVTNHANSQELDDKGKARALRSGLDATADGIMTFDKLKSELSGDGIVLDDGELLVKYLIHNLAKDDAKGLGEIGAPENSTDLMLGYLNNGLANNSLNIDEQELLTVLKAGDN
jgi:hypothetical protein